MTNSTPDVANSVLRNRTGWQFFYKHINAGSSVWGPSSNTSYNIVHTHTRFMSSTSLLLSLKLVHDNELPSNIMLESM
jgi:hypothetical protein